MAAPPQGPSSVQVSLPQIAKLIDHSLLHPTMTDAQIHAGLDVARKHGVAAACVKPYSVPIAAEALADSGVLVCAVIGFPHGNSTTAIKVAEAQEAVSAGAHEIDMVVNVGKVLGGDWEYVTNEIRAINDAVTHRDQAVLKVIFENDYLDDSHIVHLCRICSALSVAFIKTSTGYGFVKQDNGLYTYKGATPAHLKLMRSNVGPNVQIKAAGGLRTLDDVLYAMSLGVTRIGATATEEILAEAARRGIGIAPKLVEVTVPADKT
ncbi:deoxyribose-phosphate aldolase [Microdochium trichocladiopsis]|uniref:deoxyribose-phosphate aldolase n=1 Tax=Microdochium trichocladiopsis TaxID=1682393 RepID=A0A9P8Y350_9PEZI|nr:deoxyribose-phosphate aldolase [Microdochium trichocladiopsis]KAH7028831.1 deoxyribose-phosphate aldolase [Microdochium trichocladiopsis]